MQFQLVRRPNKSHAHKPPIEKHQCKAVNRLKRKIRRHPRILGLVGCIILVTLLIRIKAIDVTCTDSLRSATNATVATAPPQNIRIRGSTVVTNAAVVVKGSIEARCKEWAFLQLSTVCSTMATLWWCLYGKRCGKIGKK